MKARIPSQKNDEPIIQGERKIVRVSPDFTMTISPEGTTEPKKTARGTRKDLNRHPATAVQLNAMTARVEELFTQELDERGKEKRSDILYELTTQRFLKTFNPPSIRKYVEIAVKNRLKQEIKGFIQFCVDKKMHDESIQETGQTEQSMEKTILESMLSTVDKWVEDCYGVEVDEKDKKAVDAYIKRMKDYATKELDKRISAVTIEETSQAPIITAQETNIIEQAMQEVESAVLKEAVIQAEQPTETIEEPKEDDGQETIEKLNTAELTYAGEVASFTRNYSFFAGDSDAFAAKTGYRHKFQSLENYRRFYALRETVQKTMNKECVSEIEALARLIRRTENKKGELSAEEQEDLNILKQARQSLLEIRRKEQEAR